MSKLNGRGGQIRTDDFLLPKQALYQAELRPVYCHMECGEWEEIVARNDKAKKACVVMDAGFNMIG
jgi:hypothetical protein